MGLSTSQEGDLAGISISQEGVLVGLSTSEEGVVVGLSTSQEGYKGVHRRDGVWGWVGITQKFQKVLSHLDLLNYLCENDLRIWSCPTFSSFLKFILV